MHSECCEFLLKVLKFSGESPKRIRKFVPACRNYINLGIHFSSLNFFVFMQKFATSVECEYYQQYFTDL